MKQNKNSDLNFPTKDTLLQGYLGQRGAVS